MRWANRNPHARRLDGLACACLTPHLCGRVELAAVVAARYDATPFSNCSAECGGEGVRQRAVRCVDHELGAQLPLVACEDLGPPPPPQEPCNRLDCPPRWVRPPWTSIKVETP